MGCSSSAPEDDAAPPTPEPWVPGQLVGSDKGVVYSLPSDEPSSRRSSAPASDSGLASSHASDDALLLPDSEIQSRLLSIGRRASEDELRPPTRLYRVPSKENVELMAEHMQLYVSTKSGVITLLDVAPTDTVLDVKKKLHSKGAVSARKQRLMHGSTDLQEINQCVGCTRQFFTKSFLGDDAAIQLPDRHAIEQARVDGVEDDAAIQHERAVKL